MILLNSVFEKPLQIFVHVFVYAFSEFPPLFWRPRQPQQLQYNTSRTC